MSTYSAKVYKENKVESDYTVFVDCIENLSGLPATGFLNLFVRISELVHIAGEEMSHLVEREVRNTESILSIYEMFVDLSRKAVEDVSLLPDLVCNVIRDNYAPSGVGRFCGLNYPFFVFILNFCFIDDKSVVFRQIVNREGKDLGSP